MRFTCPGLSEAALAAHLEYLCSLSGAQRMAYVPVVASGSLSISAIQLPGISFLTHRSNALTIHYTANNHLICKGEMLLVDAGCEYKSALPVQSYHNFS
jgi:intermediate cleaving peptidase 55